MRVNVGCIPSPLKLLPAVYIGTLRYALVLFLCGQFIYELCVPALLILKSDALDYSIPHKEAEGEVNTLKSLVR